MKRTLAIILTLASTAGAAAFAQTLPLPSAPAASQAQAPIKPARIAIIDFQGVVMSTNEGQRALADLQKKYEPRQIELKKLNDEVESLTKQLQTQSDKLGEAERQNRMRSLEEKKKQLDRQAEDAQNDVKEDMQELFNTLSAKVYDVLASYVEENGFTLVLNSTQQQQNPILFATPSTDISKAVFDAYNTKSGVPAPATPAAPATKPAPRPAAKAPAAK